MLENEKIWILQNILSNVEEHNSAKLLRESLFKVIEGFTPLITSSGAGLYNGKIVPTSTVPSGITKSVFVITEPGTYNNFGGVVLPEKHFGFIFWDGNNFSISTSEIPMQDLSAIEKKVDDNETKVDNFIRDFSVTLDEENNSKSALSFKKGNDILKGFFNQEVNGKEIKYDSLKGFLYTNNSVAYNSEYPVSYAHNIKVTEEINITGVTMGTANNVASLLGIKNGVVTNLVVGLIGGDKYNVSVSPNNYDFISIGFDDVTPVKIFAKGVTIENLDAREYIDNKLIVLDSFLKTEDYVWEEITNLSNLKSNTITNINWVEESYGGKNTGSVIISSLEGYEKIKIAGPFSTDPHAYVLWLGGFNNVNSLYEKLVEGKPSQNEFIFDIDKKYEAYLCSIGGGIKIFKGKTITKEIEKDSVLKAIEEGVGTGSKISQLSKAKIAYPTNLIELNFETSDNLPTAKGTLAKGVLNYTDNAGTSFKKFATLEVQGSSSAVYPKKNWTFALFNKEDFSDDFKLRIGNWAPHSEFVFKSNWIDATHARNILSNKIWEDIVQSRKYFPKRENEVAYNSTNTNLDQRFDSGALCHVDGVPAKLFVNGSFYGIGMFNLGKKRENYDLKSSNQNHIQLAAETHTNFNSYVASEWEIRNPKTPDANFQTKINAWFASNALSGQAFKDNFEINHDLKNAIDFFLLAEFIQSPDMYTKNLMVTSWDGVKFYFLPYDMDTTFGLEWDGKTFTGNTTSIRSASFWQKFYNAYSVEIKARYKELRDAGIFSLDNVYKHADRMNKTFGVENFKLEFEAWTQVPSNSQIYTSYPQIYQWTKDRLIWLDSQYL